MWVCHPRLDQPWTLLYRQMGCEEQATVVSWKWLLYCCIAADIRQCMFFPNKQGRPHAHVHAYSYMPWLYGSSIWCTLTRPNARVCILMCICVCVHACFVYMFFVHVFICLCVYKMKLSFHTVHASIFVYSYITVNTYCMIVHNREGLRKKSK